MKCDMHIHSFHSGMMLSPCFLQQICRECYSPPEAVYETLKRRGMDLVTLTDHDSIDGAEALRSKPDFFLSEEVTCRMPSGTELHVGVYDLTEKQHLEIQRRRQDLPGLLAYLSEQRLLFSVNHIFSSLTGRRAPEDFGWLARHFPALETRNGHQGSFSNWQAAKLAHRLKKASIGGSDAHTLISAGTAFTVVPGARTKAEFLSGLRRDKGRARGSSGGYWKLTRDALLVACCMMRERLYMSLFAPLAVFVPVWTFVHYCQEEAFVRSLLKVVQNECDPDNKPSSLRPDFPTRLKYVGEPNYPGLY
ncbi:MAG TPA: PHP domain-containing protein [Terriglobia bacterium]|nr:PHP domain-containing protein [Terriglobia bacterium]